MPLRVARHAKNEEKHQDGRFANNTAGPRLMNITELFERGGPLMFAIAAASVFGVAVFLERMWAFQRSKVLPLHLAERVSDFVRQERLADARLVCSESRSSIASVYAALLQNAHLPLPLLKEAAEEAGRQEAARLERFVGVLGTVASVAPLLGLLGTVTGMISVFQRVAETGVGSPLDMAAGIWEALVTTAFGLSVGIPALLMHRFALSRVDSWVLMLEEEALRMVGLLIPNGMPDPGAQTGEGNTHRASEAEVKPVQSSKKSEAGESA